MNWSSDAGRIDDPITLDRYAAMSTSEGNGGAVAKFSDTPLNSSEFNAYWPLHFRISMTLIFSLLSFIGITGNILVIIVVFKVKRMITPTNCYLVSLAASDCLFFIATAPTELAYLHMDETEYIFGYVGCALFTYLPFLAINTSSFSIMAFTVERYIGICFPLKARYICTVKRAKMIIFLIWALCIVYNSPWLYLANLKEDHGFYSCDFKLERDNWSYKVIFLGDMLAFYVVPMFLYIFVYSRIICTLKQSSEKEVPSIVHHNSKDARIQDSYMQLTQSSTSLLGGGVTKSRQPSMNVSRKSRRKGGNQVVKMLAIVVFVFAICWLPYRSMVAYNSFAVVKWDPDWYIYFSKTMIFINCAINPILYNVMSARFRRAFRQLFKCDGHKRICKNTAKEFSATTPIIRVDRETRATTDSEPNSTFHFDFQHHFISLISQNKKHLNISTARNRYSLQM